MSMIPRRLCSRLGGPAFTLVEVLLGAVVFALMSLTLYTVFFSAMNVQRQSAVYEETAGRMHTALESMTHDLQRSLAYDFSASYPDRKAFKGGQSSITFIVASDDGLKSVGYELKESERGIRHEERIGVHTARNTAVTEKSTVEETEYDVLRLSRPLIDALNDRDDHLETRIVCRHAGPGGLTFSFGSINPDSGDVMWSSAWESDAPPAMIRVDLTMSIAEKGTRREIKLRKSIFHPAGERILR